MARDREIKMRRILEATLACIASRGFEATRLRDVSDSAEVSIGVLQHYFGSRDALLMDALEYASTQLGLRFDQLAAAGLSPWDHLEAMIKVVTEMPDLHGRGLLWLELSGLARRRPELSDKLINVYSVWTCQIRDTVKRGAEDGSLNVSEDIDDLTAILLAFFDGYEFEIASSLVENDANVLRRRAMLLAKQLFRPSESVRELSAR